MRMIVLFSSAALLLTSLQACTQSADKPQGTILGNPQSSNVTFSGYGRTGAMFRLK